MFEAWGLTKAIDAFQTADAALGHWLRWIAPVLLFTLVIFLIVRNIRALMTVSAAIDAMNGWLGRWLSWLLVVAVIVSTTNAVVRKAFDVSSNSWLELQWMLFGAVFLLCSPWTLLSNEHIRIDILNQRLPRVARGVIDIIGHMFFLLPMTLVLIWTSVPFFWRSVAGNEQSFSAGGLPQWPAKFLILIGFVMLMVQALSEIIKRFAILTGNMEDTYTSGGHHAAAEAEAERLLALAKETAH